MIIVSAITFSWSSLRDLRCYPKVSGVVMLATFTVTVATHDLSAGVAAQRRVLRVQGHAADGVHVAYDPATHTRLYTVSGQGFFASAEIFAGRFDLRDTARRALIDLTNAHLWDITAVGAQDNVAATMRRHGMSVEVVSLREASAILVDRHAHDAGTQETECAALPKS